MATTRCTGKVKGTNRRCRNRVSGKRKRCPFHSGAAKTSICWPGYERVPGTKPYSKGSCRKTTRRNPSRRRIVRECIGCGIRVLNAMRCNDCKVKRKKRKARSTGAKRIAILRKRRRELPLRRCHGITLSGKRCKRWAHGGWCGSHWRGH